MIHKSKKDSLLRLGEAARTLMHEIKNPLSAMTIQSALLRSEIPEQFHADLDLLDHEIQRLTNLANDVGEFVKNPVGNVCEIELVPFINDIIRLFKNPVKLNVCYNDKLFVLLDKDRARSVIENLLKNAFESTEKIDPQVEIIISREKRKVIIDICDRGDGIPDEIRKELFNPFFTTKPQGSGIGLALSRQFVQAAKGSLKLINRDGGGTIARVILPVKSELVK